MKLTVSIFAAGLLIGALAGGWPGRKPPEPPKTPPSPKATTREEPRKNKKWSANDLYELALADEAESPGDRDNPLRHELSSWTPEELEAALNEGLKTPGAAIEFGKVQTIMGHILREWMKRDFAGALKWFEGMTSDSVRGGLSVCLARAWPEDRIKEGFAYLLANKRYFSGNGSTSSWPMTEAALKSAAKQDAASLAEVLTAIRENDLFFPVAELEFPQGFDFSALMKAGIDDRMWKDNRASSILSAWMSRDRDAAFDAILEKNRHTDSDPSRYLFKTALPTTSEALADHVQWMTGKIQAMDGQEREQLVSKGAEAWSSHPDVLKAFADSLSDPADQRIAHEAGVKAILIAGVGNALYHLETIGDVEERLALLESMEARRSFPSIPRGFPESEETLLREKLTEWQADPKRVDAIVNRLQQAASRR